MASVSFTGSGLTRYGTSWSAGTATQGAYGTYANGVSQRGRVTFTGLSDFVTAGKTITKVRLTMTFDASGRSATKSIQCYIGNTINAYKVSAVTTAAAAYNRTTYVEWTLASDLAVFKEAILAGNNYITFYNGETATAGSSSYSTNYCKITAATLTIEYRVNTVKYFNGSNWVSCAVKYYNGSAWVDVEVKYYDGTAWKNIGG